MRNPLPILILILTIFTLAITPLAHASTEKVKFAWDANTETDLKGYRLYQSATPGSYIWVGKNPDVQPASPPPSFVKSILAPATTTEIDLTAADKSTTYFVLTAFDQDGNESGPSNEVFFVMPDQTAPTPPKGLIATLLKLLSDLFQRLFGTPLRVS